MNNYKTKIIGIEDFMTPEEQLAYLDADIETRKYRKAVIAKRHKITGMKKNISKTRNDVYRGRTRRGLNFHHKKRQKLSNELREA